MPMGSKAHIRNTMITQLQGMSSEERQRQNHEIGVRLEGFSPYQNAQKVMSYVGVGIEIDTVPFLARALKVGKKVAVPVCVTKGKKLIVSELRDLGELERGFYGLLEPTEDFIRPMEPKELDVVIIPGLAFDTTGNRLGRGGGYYDRFLAGLSSRTSLIALAYECQIIERVPTEAHDITVQWLITPGRIIDCHAK
jgi:5-formyltetrahydrofolate cyclo-ligase